METGMTALLVLIPAALLLGLVGLAAFLWTLNSGQYEDLDGAAHRILLERDLPAADDDTANRAGGRRPS
jgi:cbb3-type cytochrome oxidase maturation protein